MLCRDATCRGAVGVYLVFLMTTSRWSWTYLDTNMYDSWETSVEELLAILNDVAFVRILVILVFLGSTPITDFVSV